MTSSRRRLFASAGVNVDLSPMIDLVFLLLFFFMVSSRLITVHQDPSIVPPVASHSLVAKDTRGRVVLNLRADGSIHDEHGERLEGLPAVEVLMRRSHEADPTVRLHLRADHRVRYEKINDVVQASARGGVSSVIFATYQVE
ncbi:MAG: biopolymer transporter ExbD [Verrucomicrobiales bacterium]|nr:biopolymer transporter ExbD [Verrucomicrobiae bacterium]MCP5553501.1 biopolymer transporter ExbD [Akkermansiaceae bacterium]HRX54972.1 biopolymer transporter ExbD [Verrucomicrobiales bacterium]